MTSIPTLWLRDRSLVSPNKTAIKFKDETLTYQELYSKSSRIKDSLKFRYPETKRIGIFMKNSLDTIVLIHAICMTDIELIIINARLTTEEVEYQLDQLQTKYIITTSDFERKFENLENKQIVNVTKLTTLSNNDETTPSFEYLPKAEDILCYVYTSGTTGKPKAVPLTYANFYYSAMVGGIRLGIQSSDIWLLNMPMYHLGGLSIVFRTCIYGTSILCHENFDVDQIVNDLKQEKITQMSLVPTMLKRILPAMNNPYNLRFILLGGAKAPIPLIKEAIAKNIPIATTYGMTETCSQIVTATPEEVRSKIASVGKPLLHAKVKISNPDKEGIGEILVKGPTVTSGYVNYKNTFDGEYLPTGDLGYLDDEGDLFVLQRRSDLIISGGENIYPSEVEGILLEISEISEVCVIPKDDSDWGQIPIAILKLNDDITESQITTYLKTKLASYKLPKQYFVVDEFPMTASGKIKRNELIKMNILDFKHII